MNDEVVALLVNDRQDLFRTLEQLLRHLGIETRHAHDCSEARTLLGGPWSPRLIFTDTALIDGTWREVLSLANATQKAVPVIVVSRFVDIELYLQTLESGVCDFIVPPLSSSDVAHVVRTAVLKNCNDSSHTVRRSAVA